MIRFEVCVDFYCLCIRDLAGIQQMLSMYVGFHSYFLYVSLGTRGLCAWVGMCEKYAHGCTYSLHVCVGEHSLHVCGGMPRLYVCMDMHRLYACVGMCGLYARVGIRSMYACVSGYAQVVCMCSCTQVVFMCRCVQLSCICWYQAPVDALFLLRSCFDASYVTVNSKRI